ncbi:MAG: hypothetical protein MJ183_06865 [Treponemataceae bacterium]|nr:hypothetical protein [Treponemataceae bacterium]
MKKISKMFVRIGFALILASAVLCFAGCNDEEKSASSSKTNGSSLKYGTGDYIAPSSTAKLADNPDQKVVVKRALRNFTKYDRYGNVLGDEFFPHRAALTDAQQKAYDFIYNQLAAGNYDFKMGVSVSQDDFLVAWSAMYDENSDLIWVEPQVSYRYNKSDEVTSVTFEVYDIFNDLEKTKQDFEKAANKIIEKAETISSVAGKIKYVHDYLTDNIDYVSDSPYNQSAYSALVRGETVCSGYAHAFHYIMQQMGIPCSVIEGDAGGPHVWNIVKNEDGTYYGIDVTWDDPIGNPSGSYYTTYLMVSDKQLSSETPHVRGEVSSRLPAAPKNYKGEFNTATGAVSPVTNANNGDNGPKPTNQNSPAVAAINQLTHDYDDFDWNSDLSDFWENDFKIDSGDTPHFTFDSTQYDFGDITLPDVNSLNITLPTPTPAGNTPSPSPSSSYFSDYDDDDYDYYDYDDYDDYGYGDYDDDDYDYYSYYGDDDYDYYNYDDYDDYDDYGYYDDDFDLEALFEDEDFLNELYYVMLQMGWNGRTDPSDDMVETAVMTVLGFGDDYYGYYGYDDYDDDYYGYGDYYGYYDDDDYDDYYGYGDYYGYYDDDDYDDYYGYGNYYGYYDDYDYDDYYGYGNYYDYDDYYDDDDYDDYYGNYYSNQYQTAGGKFNYVWRGNNWKWDSEYEEYYQYFKTGVCLLYDPEYDWYYLVDTDDNYWSYDDTVGDFVLMDY